MALAARLRGRVQDWSLRPNEWQSIPDLNADSAGSDAQNAVSKLRKHLKSLSTHCAKGDGFPESHTLVVASHVRTREMPLVGEIAASGAVKSFRISKTAKVPDMFRRNRARAYYVLRASGNSMAGDGIGAGTLLVYEDQTGARDGQMVVRSWVDLDGAGFITRAKRSPQPLNPLIPVLCRTRTAS
jgi:SOS-response transcriptional repressor LexA